MTKTQKHKIICELALINYSKPTLDRVEGKEENSKAYYDAECELRNTLIIENVMPLVEHMGLNWCDVNEEIDELFGVYVRINYPDFSSKEVS